MPAAQFSNEPETVSCGFCLSDNDANVSVCDISREGRTVELMHTLKSLKEIEHFDLISLARGVQPELLQPQSVPELCQQLKSIQKRLQEESESIKSRRCLCFEETLTAHQVEEAQQEQC